MFFMVLEITQMRFHCNRRRPSAWTKWGWAVCLLGLLAASCSKRETMVDMGMDVSVSPLTYSVVRTEWKDSLDGPDGQRTPAHKFLIVSISIRNKSGSDVHVPLLTVIDGAGKEHLELDKGDGLGEWLGLLRTVQPKSTTSGELLFDVPPGTYKLRVVNGGDVEKETSALIRLPYQTELPAPAAPANLPTPLTK
jgi:hypothetical protein